MKNRIEIPLGRTFPFKRQLRLTPRDRGGVCDLADERTSSRFLEHDYHHPAGGPHLVIHGTFAGIAISPAVALQYLVEAAVIEASHGDVVVAKEFDFDGLLIATVVLDLGVADILREYRDALYCRAPIQQPTRIEVVEVHRHGGVVDGTMLSPVNRMVVAMSGVHLWGGVKLGNPVPVFSQL